MAPRRRAGRTGPRWRCARPRRRRPRGGPDAAARARRGVFAHLRWRHHRGPSVTVPFGRAALLSGRLLDADGAGLAGRSLRVVARPSRGALAERRVYAVRTGPHGGFRLPLPAGPSRRITVIFAGEPGFDGARRPALALRVRGGVELQGGPERGCGPVRRCGSGAGCAPGARRCPDAASWSRSSTTSRRRGAGARCWSPAATTAAASAPATASATSRHGADPAAGGRPGRGALALRAWSLAIGGRPRQRLTPLPADGPKASDMGRPAVGGRVGRRCRRRRSTPAPGRSCSSCTTRTRRRPSRTSASSPPTASTTTSSSTASSPTS